MLLDHRVKPSYPLVPMVEQPSSADAYSALEQRFREPARALLMRIYHPLVLLLAWLGVSPNQVSLLSDSPGTSHSHYLYLPPSPNPPPHHPHHLHKQPRRGSRLSSGPTDAFWSPLGRLLRPCKENTRHRRFGLGRGSWWLLGGPLRPRLSGDKPHPGPLQPLQDPHPPGHEIVYHRLPLHLPLPLVRDKLARFGDSLLRPEHGGRHRLGSATSASSPGVRKRLLSLHLL